jgi:gamma-glutamylcyclotransferase (GGCT)/AIG2-like uncharacterized protein YtfP
MRAYGNHRLLRVGSDSDFLSSKFIGEAVTIPDCYTMITGGFPYVLKNGISHIKGELYEVPDERVMQQLDGLEGVPNHYIRHETTVNAGYWANDGAGEGEGLSMHEVECIMYVASPSTEKYIRENHPNYLKERFVVPNDDNICEWPGPYYKQQQQRA